jgi:glycosyltransferase involved in cell wall biosynthesis
MCLGEEKILDTLAAKIWQKIKRKQFNGIKYIISPSDWLLKLHLEKKFFPQAKTLTIFNPLNINQRPPERKKQNSENYTFVYLGQVDEEKGLNLLFSAFTELKTGVLKTKKIKLKIIGKGKDLNELKNKYKNNTSITFTGYLKEKEVREELRKSNCLILPSLIYENSPTVIFDAFLSNLNIIASDTGGTPEIIKKYYGHLFKAGNKKDLIEKMNLVLNEKNIKKAELKNLNSANYIKNILYWLK